MVKFTFNGVTSFYLYAEGEPVGSPYCLVSDNEHAAIYGFQSSNGINWSPLNYGQPVLQVPSGVTYTGSGLFMPSAIASKLGGNTPISGNGSCLPGVRPVEVVLYYSQTTDNASGVSPDGIYAARSQDGVNFNTESLGPGASPLIPSVGAQWQPSVKKIGPSGADLPLVMILSTAYGTVSTAIQTSPCAGWEPVVLLGGGLFAPSAVYGKLEGDGSGRWIDTLGNYVTQGDAVNIWWDSGPYGSSYLYKGPASTTTFFGY